MKHKVLDLFSGIGGFSLGLERTGGFETVAFCEIDKKAQLVLKKHWANVPIYEDIKALTNDRLKTDGILPTVITAGFPCTDLSIGDQYNNKGLDGERSGLFFEITRLVCEIRPAYCILENVTTLLDNREFGRLLGEFSKVGNYVVEWHCISAESIGAPHKRDRVWIVATKTKNQISDPMRKRLERCELAETHSKEFGCRWSRSFRSTSECSSLDGRNFWFAESKLDRVAHGIPNRIHRIKQLGNSLVPQIPEMIGNAILKNERISNESK